MPIEPLSPNNVTTRKQSIIPDVVIECFNELIAQNYGDDSSTFKQIEVADLICLKMRQQGHPDFNNRVIYDKHWLDVESIYRGKGWIVEYDKPGFNESYDATFTFKRRRKKS